MRGVLGVAVVEVAMVSVAADFGFAPHRSTPARSASTNVMASG